jgi:hypothetical protein
LVGIETSLAASRPECRIGKLLDALLVREQSEAGIKIFLVGLKAFTEKQ